MIRYRLEYAGLRILLGIFALLPPEAASNAGGALFRGIGPFMGISKVARRNISTAFPHWTREQVTETLRGMWDNLGRIVAEYPHLDVLSREYTSFRNPHAFDALRGRAVVFAGAHIGNWEILPPAFMYGQDIRLHSAYRAPNNPMVDALILKLRGFGGRLKSFGKTRKGLGEILKTLQADEAVGMLIDQKMNTGIEAIFFGRPAMTSTAFVELARKVGCPLVPGRIIRVKGCRFEIDICDPIPVGERPTDEIVADMHKVLEAWISEHPAQWLWLHRRWKT